MSYLLIYDSLLNHIKERFPKRIVNSYIGRSRHANRFIQISTPIDDFNIHYEYINGRVCLHFEGNSVISYKDLIDFLMQSTENDEMFEWGEWGSDSWCCKYFLEVDTVDQLDRVLDTVMPFFDNLINSFFSNNIISPNKEIPQFKIEAHTESSVDLYTLNLKKVLGLPLKIPSYQRIYCWERRNVLCLLEDISNHLENQGTQSVPYRLGTIILHYHDDKYDIIDGQQRLITLSLLLNEMGIHSNLLEERVFSKEASDYISFNKYLIQNYLQKYRSRINENIVLLLDFNVLILKNSSLDLAYTFFSNENSRGVELTDYDLLKAHHLRFIPPVYEVQSRNLAEGWNAMLLKGRETAPEEEAPNYERALDTYIYCLRRWMRQKECETDNKSRYIKREYEAAPIIEEIPPFGEKFYFNEPIQGGSHFFSFVEQHMNIYNHFITTKEYKILHRSIVVGSDIWYRDAIEALLFGYYAKFGEVCFTDALAVFLRAVFQHRYENRRALRSSILRHIGNQRYVQMIDHATSPTFFLAEVRNIVKYFPIVYLQQLTPTQIRMKQIAKNICKELEDDIIVESFKTLNK